MYSTSQCVQLMDTSASQCSQLMETSCFADNSTCLHFGRKLTSTLTTGTLLQWCGNVKSLTLGMCIHDCSIKHELDGDSSVHGKLIQMYTRCGDIDSAHVLFLLNPQQRNVFVWNVMIRAYTHLGQHQMAYELFNQMLCEGILADNFTIVCIITSCSCKVFLAEGRRVHARMMVGTSVADHLVMNALLNMYSKLRSLEDVRKIFINMSERNIVAWTAMVDAFLQHGLKADALQYFGHMQGEGVFPDIVFLLTIMSACSESATLSQGRQLHVSILEMGYEFDIFLRTALVNMYGNCGVTEDACKVFAQPFEQNVVLWNSFISIHTLLGLDADALQHLNRMLLEGVLPDRVTFLHGLSACANKADIVEGSKMHILALSVPSGLDVMLGTNVVYMYGKCGHLEAACQAFLHLRDHSVVSWNVMLGVLTQHGESLKAFNLFGAMQKQGVLPDVFTFVHVLEACMSPAALTEGEHLHNYIVEMGFESDVAVGTALVNMYVKCSGIEGAYRMFEEMPERNVVSWNSIIMAHVQRGKHRDAFQLFTEMHSKGISPDSSTLASIVDACVSESLFSEAVVMHAYVVESGFDIDNTLGIPLVNMYGKLGSVEDAVQLFKILRARDVLTWTAMLTAHVWSGNNEEAVRLYAQMESEGLVAIKATYLVVLEACGDLSVPARGNDIFISIAKQGLDLDAAVATALVNFYGKCASLHVGKRVFDSVPKKDVILWTAMITMYAQNGLGKEALCLFADMQDSGLIPNYVTYVNALAACSHAGLVQEGYYFLASMMWDYGMPPLVDHYDCAIDLFGRAGLLDEAEHLVDRMPFLPRVVSFMALLGACRCQADLERGVRIAKCVVNLDFESSAPYVLYSNITLTEARSG